MSNVTIKAAGTEFSLPPAKELEISQGNLKIAVSFNANGSVTLTHNVTDLTVQAEAPAAPVVQRDHYEIWLDGPARFR